MLKGVVKKIRLQGGSETGVVRYKFEKQKN